ncbi:MFS transporter [Actinoallomurus soli]|uniref:MFS transporter n=1 Tax=Actinoallomurus soli TaxID=2952535 RepID=UPI0020939E02|nr:MFS transporter [Actinoallomurus soli]MCO5970071.1 MFS transporter [Actinoallomurus soli]
MRVGERAFLRVWLAQSVSLMGSQITLIALPLTAITLFAVSPGQMGVLVACGRLPYLVFGLAVGVFVDRTSRRRLVVTANVGLAAVVGTVPLAALGDRLHLWWLYAVAAVAGTLTVLFDVAFLAYVPEVTPPERLPRAQSLQEVSQSLALVLGPPLAGALIARLGPPLAISGDALSFVIAALVIALPMPSVPRRPVRALSDGVLVEVRKGAVSVLGDPVLRNVTSATCLLYIANTMFTAVYLLFLTRSVHLGALAIGLVMGVGAVGGIIGAGVAPWLGRRIGTGSLLGWALLVCASGLALAPLVVRPLWAAVAVATVSQLVNWFGQQVYNVHQVPIRYLRTQQALHGRVNATIKTITWGGSSLGAAIGGWAAGLLGVRPVLLVSAVVAGAAGLALMSPATARLRLGEQLGS